MNNPRLTYLLQHYLDKTASKDEVDEMMLLLNKTENDDQLKLFMDRAWKQQDNDGKIFDDGQRSAMLQQILMPPARTTASTLTTKSLQTTITRWGKWTMAAAAVLFIVGCIYIITATNLPETGIEPGQHKAIITFSNGNVTELDNNPKGKIAVAGHVSVQSNKAGVVEYKAVPNSSAADIVSWNTITTPRGGEYEIILDDGTKVWLNAASSLHYPTVFKGSERKVELVGEGYFEVAKNRSTPFKVQVNNMQVEVLGTHFNINAYNDCGYTKTTLLEGSVKVSSKTDSVVLKPGQQALFYDDGKIVLKDHANTQEAVAWTTNYFQFESTDFNILMAQIARWYDVNVVYPEGMVEGRYTGRISRTTSITKVLTIIKLSGINSSIEGRKIIIEK